MSSQNSQAWYVYIVRCADGTLYTGICRRPKARLDAHNKSNTGAKYTRSRRPVKLVYCRRLQSRGLALKKETQIKKLSRRDKEKLIGCK